MIITVFKWKVFKLRNGYNFYAKDSKMISVEVLNFIIFLLSKTKSRKQLHTKHF